MIWTQISEKKAKNGFEKDVFGKTMENVRKRRDTKLVTIERRRNYLVSEPNCHATKFFTKHLLQIKMNKVEILMNKPVHLGRSILELSKILMYEFWYNYIKPKYDKKAKLCYMDTDSFIVYLKTDVIYKDIETRFDTWNYEVACNSIPTPLAKGKNKKVNGLMKDE